MATTTEAVRPSQRKTDILAALLWALLASIRLSLLVAKPSLLQVGLFMFALTIPLLFVVRRPSTAQGPAHTFWLAVFGTLFPLGTLRTAEAGWRMPGEIVQIVGLAITLVSIWTLRRSFGLAPAHRGLVTRGAYALIRHPLYAGELLGMTGYCIGYMSPLNWLVLVITASVQAARIFAEEKLLSEDREYRAYQERVRWRLVPGIW